MERKSATGTPAHGVLTCAHQAGIQTGRDGQHSQHSQLDWRIVDRALRTIAQRRAGLDAEEARWLREAEALQIWKQLAMVSAQDYVERVLGYAPRTARDRLRVARALGGLPQLTGALASGTLSYSAVRELTRVATDETEGAWLDHAQGRSLREVEELVADHRLGDHPDDPKDPNARTHVVRLELSADTFALLRQARQVLDNEHGTCLSEDQLVAQLCHAVLDGAAPGAPTGRAKFQVALTVCERCQQGWQHGAGAKVPIGAATVERALCDAQHIGSIDGDEPARAYQDISPSVARFVWHRDAGRCRVPGCRSSRGLELHHLVHRADGGTHDASNIALMCSACHLSHHAGALQITGTASHMTVVRRAHRHHRAPPSHMADTGDHVSTSDVHEEGNAPVTAAQVAGTGAHVSTSDVLEQGNARVTTARVADTGAHVSTMPADKRRNPIPDVAHEPQSCTGAMPAMASGLAELCGDATLALKQLGWRPAVAQVAVHAAASMLGDAATLERVLVEALKRCPLPPGTSAPASGR